jgi:hypothetical protein
VSQDAGTTAAIIKDTVEDLSQLTNIKELHFFSDNAGCYKNTLMMSTFKQEFEEKVKTYNFSESQDGKGEIMTIFLVTFNISTAPPLNLKNGK